VYLRKTLFLIIFILNWHCLISQTREDLSLIFTGKLPDIDSVFSYDPQPHVSQKDNMLLVFIKFPILFYQEFISSQMKPRCYFYPSCSQFSLEAIQQYGFLGVFLGIDRIMRCNVFSEDKYPLYNNTIRLYDPVSHYRLNNKDDKQIVHKHKMNSINPPD
jgi:putative membrane protein insertion efficiency factor